MSAATRRPSAHGEGNGINVYRVDPRSGAFRHVQQLGGLEYLLFLALNKAGTHLYSVHGDRSEATSYTTIARPATPRCSTGNRPAATTSSISISTPPGAFCS